MDPDVAARTLSCEITLSRQPKADGNPSVMKTVSQRWLLGAPETICLTTRAQYGEVE